MGLIEENEIKFKKNETRIMIKQFLIKLQQSNMWVFTRKLGEVPYSATPDELFNMIDEFVEKYMKLTDTAEAVLEKRYYLKNGRGECVENWNGLSWRVAEAVGGLGGTYTDRFRDMIYNLDFLPNSPCLMNAGTEIGQLSACFVLPIEDSMDGIFTSIKNGALIHKSGGGTGYSFSRLRAKNSNVQSTQGVASGPLSFAKVFDAATETVKQGGKRKGANMMVLSVDHPDIYDFVRAKK